jgi:plasmid stabilization system protein ParE
VFEISFTQAARWELIDAQEWYERELPGLGSRFRSEIDPVVERMTANPLQFPLLFQNIRRALIRRFPYMLLFTIDGDALTVMACFHASRDPCRWQERS